MAPSTTHVGEAGRSVDLADLDAHLRRTHAHITAVVADPMHERFSRVLGGLAGSVRWPCDALFFTLTWWWGRCWWYCGPCCARERRGRHCAGRSGAPLPAAQWHHRPRRLAGNDDKATAATRGGSM
eukprot:scaffold931_cov383-Prasinococcus_capsulatus_cf.AAC.13